VREHGKVCLANGF